MTIIAVSALATPLWFVLFPELAALSFELFAHPAGRWARKPLAVAISPTATGALGVIIGHFLGFSPLAVAVTVVGSMALFAVLRSAATPALSAGLLAVVLHVESPLYPVGIVYGAGVLLGGHALYVRRVGAAGARERGDSSLIASEQVEGDPSGTQDRASRVDPCAAREQPLPICSWLGDALLLRGWIVLFATVLGVLVMGTDQRLLLVPPLVVLAFEACHD
ncbi:MAG: hypothetical protein AB7R89_01680 [Dehalococcoidia bacterium]